VSAVQTRSLVAVGGVASNSSAEQTVSAVHVRSDVGDGAAVSYSVALHTRNSVHVVAFALVE
jgi:hypothetical protein